MATQDPSKKTDDKAPDTTENTVAAKESATATAETSELVKVEFPDGTDANGKQLYRTQEVSKALADEQLALPTDASKIKEGEPVKLQNPAWKGARLKK